LCAEFLGVLDVMLQKHHDRMARCLQSQTPENRPEQRLQSQPTENRAFGSSASAWADSDEDDPVAEELRHAYPVVTASPEGVDAGDIRPTAEGSAPVDAARYAEVRSNPSTFSQFEVKKRMCTLYQPNSNQLPPGQKLEVTEEEEPSRLRIWWLKVLALVRSGGFELIMSILIMSNVIYCGVEVEYLAQTKLNEPPVAFRWVSLLFTIAFTMELILRLASEGRDFVKRPNRWWNLFDSFLVAVALADVAFGGAEDSSGGMTSLRVMRMVRVVRVLRIARIMRHFRSLRILISSVLHTLRSLGWTMVLLGMITYVFGILFTQAATQHLIEDGSEVPRLEDAYGTVGRSIFTLFQAISGGVDWGNIVIPLGLVHPMWVAFYLLYFSFTYFAVLNVVTGVFCHTAIESASLDQDMAVQAQMAAKQVYVQRLQTLFSKINTKNTGKITLDEFEASMKDEKLLAYFASIELSIDEAFSLFKLLDRDGEHELDIDAFVTGCLKLRGQAKSIDIAMMMYETRWTWERCLQSMKHMEQSVRRLHDNTCMSSPMSAFASCHLGPSRFC